MMKHRILLLCILFQTTCYCQVSLPSFFGDNMVLQQNDSVSIWGTDTPERGIEITSSWGSRNYVKTDLRGNWRTKIKTGKASFEKHQMEIRGSTSVMFENILIGEVWLCSGQSNMEMPMKGLGSSPVNGSDEFIRNAKNPQIRLFNTERAGSVKPEMNVSGKWKEASSISVSEFSAIGYLFGKKIYEMVNVPVGIIEASWGGTRIEAWIPKDSLIPYKVKIPKILPEDITKRKQPTQIYNGMIHPFQDYTLKGFLWYQGESNRTDPEPYRSYMHTLISSWRNQWYNHDLPFYFVQIAPYAYEKNRSTPAIKTALIREAQLMASLQINNTGLVVTTDVGDCDDIHPAEKELIANRLTYWALANQYGFSDIPFTSPTYKYMETLENENKVRIHFNLEHHGQMDRIVNFAGEAKGFTIAAEDKVFYPAKAVINEDGTIEVFSSRVPNPVAVRYGFEDCFQGGLYNLAKLPVSPFRTDDWE